MKVLKTFTNIINKLLIWVITILFLLMFGVTNLNVITRYFFNSPIIVSVEMGRYCFVSIIFLGAILTTREDRHIHVDFFVSLLPEKLNRLIDQIGRILMAGFFALLTFYTCKMALANTNVISSAMKIPMSIPYGIMAVGCFGITVESIINIVANALGIERNIQKTEGVND